MTKVLNLIFIELLCIVLVGKAFFINTKFILDDSSFYYRIFQSLSHDSLVFFFIFLLLYLSYLKFIPYLLGFVFRSLSLFLIILYLADIYILINFATHLVFNDIVKYLSYAPQYIEHLYTLDTLILSCIFLTLIICMNFLIKRNEPSHVMYPIFILTFFIINQFAPSNRFIHSWLNKDYLTYNYEVLDQSREYSKQLKNALRDNESFMCENSLSQTPNIIILMVESLASYQSKFFSNIQDWTPQLDKIAQQNISYKNFFANGFVTEDAEIAMLTGELPIYSPNAFSDGGGVSFDGFYNLKNTLPKLLKQYSYNSEFITSSDLEFSNTGNWAKSIGFEYIEGSEQADYEGKQRFHFGAAADEFLYKRVFKRLEKQSSKHLLFIKTVSSHAPFINPRNGNKSEEEAIRYMDEQIGHFYKNLQKTDFFNNGILFIVGDHHPAIFLKEEELTTYGNLKASSIVPLVIAYKNKQHTVNKNFDQIDVFTTLKNLVSKRQCYSSIHNDLLSITNNIDISLHRRGDERGIISIFTQNENFNVKLLGDDTHALSNNEHQNIVQKINYSRIQRENELYQFTKK